jgi:hypothetical protein
MRERPGRKLILGSSVVVALGIGTLAIIVVLRRRRPAAEEISGEPRETTRERFEEDLERQTWREMGTAEPLSNNLEAEAKSTEDDTQDLTDVVQQVGMDKADEAIIQDTAETGGSAREEIRRAKGPVRLRPLKGQPMMSVIRGSVRRSRGGA